MKPLLCFVNSSLQVKEAFLAESYLYHQVFIRIKHSGLKWVTVLRDIRPYTGMWEAQGLSVLTAGPLSTPHPLQHTHIHEQLLVTIAS